VVKNRLSESEERELIRRAKAGDDGARNRLWEAFFPFAVAECRKQAELANLDADIAEGEAALAIPEAISRFDLRRQKRFSTYLAHRLRGAITAATREHHRSSILIGLNISRISRKRRRSGARSSRALRAIFGRRR
jgi:DNA-directed RNA polymerase specialized sigma subunit